MGRQQYLIRLALGRSAYQGPGIAQETSKAANDGTTVGELNPGDDDHYVQHYDRKGRPINPATDARNAEMRRAQNSILALVGVVEDRDRSRRTTEREGRRTREEYRELLKEEDDRGSDLDLLADVSFAVASWWTGTIVDRYLIGYYTSSRPFLHVIVTEWRAAFSGGFKIVYETIFPGAAAWVMYQAARIGCMLMVEALVEGMSKLTWRKDRKVRTQRQVEAALEWVEVGLGSCTDALLLPLCYYSTAQSLGLAPAFPLVAPWSCLVPWHKTSLHNFGWSPLVRLPFAQSLTSPAALLLAHRFLIVDTPSDTHTPIASQFTSFRYPSVNKSSLIMDKPAFTQDPIGRVLHEAYDVRTSFLAWCGWKIVPMTREYSNAHLENDVSVEVGRKGYTVTSAHRSTLLAHLPAQHLAVTVDKMLTKLWTIQFETLVMRAVAMSYLASPLPKTAQALLIKPSLYPPFTGRLVSWLRAPGFVADAVSDVGQYASKVGLGLALHVAVKTAVFAAVYGLVRWQGSTRFGWGRKNETEERREYS